MSEECCNFVNMEKDEVEHIAIVRCERQSEICPGNYCLRAFFNSTDYFELLKNKKKSLVGFFNLWRLSWKKNLQTSAKTERSGTFGHTLL